MKINFGTMEEDSRIQEIFDGPDGKLLSRYFDYKTTVAIQKHDVLLGIEQKPTTKRQLEMFKLAVKRCIEMNIDPTVLSTLELVFKNEKDIETKLALIKENKETKKWLRR